MTDEREALVKLLGFYIDDAGGVAVLRWIDGGCHPASESEIAMWNALTAQESAAEPVANIVQVAPDVLWLYTHCRAIGMDCKSYSGKMVEDIALFTVNLQSALQVAQQERDKCADLNDRQGKRVYEAEQRLQRIEAGLRETMQYAAHLPDCDQRVNGINGDCPCGFILHKEKVGILLRGKP